MGDVDDLGRAVAHHGRADEIGTIGGELDIEAVVDDVDDLVDGETHRVLAVGEDDQRLGPFAADRDRRIGRNERHEPADTG